jgi:TetR/AcrR family transcriptional regulator, cholesterol catabolism regulator
LAHSFAPNVRSADPVRSYDRRLQALLAAAARTFAERGFHATSMRDLSRASGMSLAGIYHYVASKQELLFMIQDRCLEKVTAGAREAVAEPADLEGRITAFIRHHVVFFAAHMHEMKVLVHEAEQLTGTMKQQVVQRKRDYVAIFADLIDQMPGRTTTPIAAVWGAFGMANWIYTWYKPTGQVPPTQLGDELATIFLRGVSAQTAAPAASRPA